MSNLTNKIDFTAIISVNNANPNGDPLFGNRPRMDFDGYGEISDVCIKRKIRNRMQDLGQKVFVQSNERTDDEFKCLKDRAENLCTEKKVNKDPDKFVEEACNEWIDVRTFGQVFSFKDFSCKSVGVRGPVTIHQVVSIDPIDVDTIQITKSVNNDKAGDKCSDTMGAKHSVKFGLYLLKGSINVQLAEKTGFSEDDADIVKECLRTLFVNDVSSARPDGSMEVVKLYWWKHNCKDGQYSSAKVHRLVDIKLKEDIVNPKSVDDYNITVRTLDGLACEEIEGL